MKQRKVSSAQWPTQTLVLWRSTLDDVPLLLTPDRHLAARYAKRIPEQDVKAAHNVMGLDECSPCNITAVTFRNGRPTKMKVIRDMVVFEDDSKPNATAPTSTTPTARGKKTHTMAGGRSSSPTGAKTKHGSRRRGTGAGGKS